MTMAGRLSQKELEDVKPYVDKLIQSFFGLSEPAVVNATISLLASGADKYQMTQKLRTVHPALTERAHKLADRIFELVADYAMSVQQMQAKAAKKRPAEKAQEAPPVKSTKMADNGPTPSPGQLTNNQIKEMMANAQRMIEERKKTMSQQRPALPPPGMITLQTHGMMESSIPVGVIIPPVVTSSNASSFGGDKQAKLAELQAQIQSRINAAGLLKKDNDDDDAKSTKPVPLLLDNEGRAIDVSGNQLLFPQHQPTLKANIRAQKRAEFRHQFNEKPKVEEEVVENRYFDDRLVPKKGGPDRKKRALKFNDPGKYVTLANRERMQAQLAILQNEIADKARKTGISQAARLAKLSGAAGTGDKGQEYIPQVEWWDSLLLEDKDGNDVTSYDSQVRDDAATNLIEHPIQLKCPTDPTDPMYMPVFLTKKERKKLRRQNRRENWKDQQEKIRLGLEAAPAAKVRISNLMRVLGVEAVQDPTKVEAHVRKEMARRLKTHVDANENRKLTPEQRKEKKLKKLEEDVSLGVNVCVYRIDCLGNQSKRFKVDTVAKQLMMTGVLMMYRECNVVVVEGGPKQQKKYRRLMTVRIKWEEDVVKDKTDVANKCVLVWEGMTKERAFNEFKFKSVKTEEQAREYFKKYNIQHYWDLALSGTVFEAIGEPV